MIDTKLIILSLSLNIKFSNISWILWTQINWKIHIPPCIIMHHKIIFWSLLNSHYSDKWTKKKCEQNNEHDIAKL